MKKVLGFTFMELMIAVLIVGILAAIAIPNYSRYQVRGRRVDAEAVLMDLSQREQQYLVDARAYTDNLTLLNNYVVPSGVLKWYTVTVVAAAGPPPSFTITATPKLGQAQDGPLTINNLGVKTPSDKW